MGIQKVIAHGKKNGHLNVFKITFGSCRFWTRLIFSLTLAMMTSNVDQTFLNRTHIGFSYKLVKRFRIRWWILLIIRFCQNWFALLLLSLRLAAQVRTKMSTKPEQFSVNVTQPFARYRDSMRCANNIKKRNESQWQTWNIWKRGKKGAYNQIGNSFIYTHFQAAFSFKLMRAIYL